MSRGGRASRLKLPTRVDLQRRYGQFLGFLRRSQRLNGNGSTALITPDNVNAYVVELQKRVSSVTTYGSIFKLRRMGELLDRQFESGWPREIEQDLAWQMRPANRQHRIVDSDRLVAAGLRLMDQAGEDTTLPPVRRAMMYRDGLMIALLAVCPIRLKNYAALEIGRTLRKVGDRWMILLPAADTKCARADERAVPSFLTSCLEKYLACYRHPAQSEEPLLWIGMTGHPMTYQGVEALITRTTQRALGIPINPHLFRSCAASTACLHASDNPGLAAALLQHTDPRVTERHYNRARSAGFTVEFGRMIERAKEGC